MNETINQIKNLGIIEYLHSIVEDETADIVLSTFLAYVLQNHSEEDIEDLEENIIEDLGEFYE